MCELQLSLRRDGELPLKCNPNVDDECVWYSKLRVDIERGFGFGR